jgi:putative hemolysin
MATGIAIVLICVLLSAIFSGSETAFTSLNKIQLEKEANTDETAVRLLRVVRDPKRFLATVLVGNNITNIFGSAVLTAATIQSFGESYVPYATGILTIVVLLFAEVLPKSIATTMPRTISTVALPFIVLVEWLLLPAILLVSTIARFLLWMLRIPSAQPIWAPGDDELRIIFDTSRSHGALDHSLGSILDAVLELDDTAAKQVMVGRSKVVAVPLDAENHVVYDLVLHNGYARLPVYEDELDNIVGYLEARAFLQWMHTSNRGADSTGRWQSLVRSLSFHLENTPLHDILKTMQEQRSKIACVVDEYGSFEGIVTLPDILDEILFTKTAVDKIPVVRRIDGSIELPGDVPLRDAEYLLGHDLPAEGAGTVGGLAIQLGARGAGETVFADGIGIEVLRGTATEVRNVRLFVASETSPSYYEEASDSGADEVQ